ncbi:hypothetical protein GCM10023075_78280 [Streptosporangium album]
MAGRSTARQEALSAERHVDDPAGQQAGGVENRDGDARAVQSQDEFGARGDDPLRSAIGEGTGEFLQRPPVGRLGAAALDSADGRRDLPLAGLVRLDHRHAAPSQSLRVQTGVQGARGGQHAGRADAVGGEGVDRDLDDAHQLQPGLVRQPRDEGVGGVAGHGEHLAPRPLQPLDAAPQVRGRVLAAAEQAQGTVGDAGVAPDDDGYVSLVAGGRRLLHELAVEVDGGCRAHAAQDADQPGLAHRAPPAMPWPGSAVPAPGDTGRPPVATTARSATACGPDPGSTARPPAGTGAQSWSWVIGKRPLPCGELGEPGAATRTRIEV